MKAEGMGMDKISMDENLSRQRGTVRVKCPEAGAWLVCSRTALSNTVATGHM